MNNKVVPFDRDPREELKDLIDEAELDDFVFAFFTKEGDFRVTCSKMNHLEVQGMLEFTKHIMMDGFVNGED